MDGSSRCPANGSLDIEWQAALTNQQDFAVAAMAVCVLHRLYNVF
jgi:hypothetical protein